MRSETKLWIIGILLASMIISGLVIPLFIKHSSDERIIAVSWYREVHISEWKTVSRTGSYVPANGRETNTWVESRKTCSGYKDGVCTGYTTWYDRRYRYDIEEWVFTARLITKGSDKRPYWANTDNIRRPIGNPQIGDQRAYNAVESYTLYLTETPNEYNTSFGFWDRFDIEDLVAVTRNGYGYPIDIIAR